MNTEQTVETVLPESTAGSTQRVTHAQQRFYDSNLCAEAREQLQALVDNPEYNTDPSSLIGSPVPFVERHLHHLSMYPKTNLNGYLSNLRIMTSAKRARPAN